MRSKKQVDIHDLQMAEIRALMREARRLTPGPLIDRRVAARILRRCEARLQNEKRV